VSSAAETVCSSGPTVESGRPEAVISSVIASIRHLSRSFLIYLSHKKKGVTYTALKEEIGKETAVVRRGSLRQHGIWGKEISLNPRDERNEFDLSMTRFN